MIILIETETREKLEKIFARYKGKNEELIPILQEVQEEFRYVPADAMMKVARFLRIPESTVFGVSTFYAQFKLTPLGKKVVKICRGTACHVRGGKKILEETEKQLCVKAGETTEDMEWTLETIACFGACALAPVMVIDKDVHGRMATNKVKDVLTGTE